MNPEFALLISNLTSIACVISAAILATRGTEAWGWFLFVALLAGAYPKSVG